MADFPQNGDGSAPYRVLARKYRPSHFGELIGQGPMVRTLRNAFAHDRIPQAWMLTGVRGVGKTTTARILARALNYEREGEERHPTVDFVDEGVHCRAIMEGRHVDVIEMDAASHTSINDIREITDAARYKPVSALYKVYIIDEVHMLSTAAFNGLLKTLEEPPAHVKFIFATTEIRKVPVTVLSRCQRFDLRRIDGEELTQHLTMIAGKEAIEADEEALRLISRAAEGSVRDALSLLDQAIAHAGGRVTAETLRDMLGLADRTRIVDLFELVMKGEAAGALAELAAQYEVGADPTVVLTDLASFTHQVTRQKVTNAAPEPGEPQEVRERSAKYAAALPMAALSRMWQALLAGIAEVQAAPKPMMAAEMVVIRLCYLANLPDPAALPLSAAPGVSTGGGGSHAASGGGGGGARGAASVVPYAQAAPAPAPTAPAGPPMPTSFAEMAALIGAQSVKLKRSIEREMRLKRFERGRIEVSLEPEAEPAVVGQIGKKLTEMTGERWIVTVSDGATAPTLHEAHEAEQARLKAEAEKDPLVRALLARFQDAEIASVQTNAIPDGEQARSRAQGEG
ncbi:DNA polymerase III subunit gamma/tau [Acuticoccus sp. M5D2P5]|nr:DNA polymerase III subunit gamma/tau [Acuticoccus kalidii]MCF3935896.1 DNA polymerase III subunit gamma/tau [Acuticoccus kalidii]